MFAHIHHFTQTNTNYVNITWTYKYQQEQVGVWEPSIIFALNLAMF
jgi:hypothetical protein